MTTISNGPAPRRRRVHRAATIVGWLVIAAFAAAVTYALLVFGGH